MVAGWLAGWLAFRESVIREHMDRKASDSLQNTYHDSLYAGPWNEPQQVEDNEILQNIFSKHNGIKLEFRKYERQQENL